NLPIVAIPLVKPVCSRSRPAHDGRADQDVAQRVALLVHLFLLRRLRFSFLRVQIALQIVEVRDLLIGAVGRMEACGPGSFGTDVGRQHTSTPHIWYADYRVLPWKKPGTSGLCRGSFLKEIGEL